MGPLEGASWQCLIHWNLCMPTNSKSTDTAIYRSPRAHCTTLISLSVLCWPPTESWRTLFRGNSHGTTFARTPTAKCVNVSLVCRYHNSWMLKTITLYRVHLYAPHRNSYLPILVALLWGKVLKDRMTRKTFCLQPLYLFMCCTMHIQMFFEVYSQLILNDHKLGISCHSICLGGPGPPIALDE